MMRTCFDVGIYSQCDWSSYAFSTCDAAGKKKTSVAMSSGSSSPLVTSGESSQNVAVSVITLSRSGYRKMLQNLWWAAGYNLVSVPLAAGVLAGVGFVLPPAVGAILMSLSTIVVAANAQLLRRLDLTP